MREYKLTESEEKFAELIWQNEPIGSGDLVKLCEKEMNWKKSTTYTVLKKLCEKGIFQNENAIVSFLSILTYMHTSSFDKLFLNLHKDFTRDYRLCLLYTSPVPELVRVITSFLV